MLNYKEDVIRCGMYMADCDCTLKQVAEIMMCSMSTVYNRIMKWLPSINHGLYERCRDRMEEHKHRGGRKHGSSMSV